MNNNDQTLKVLRDELNRLRKERTDIDSKVTSLENAVKALGGGSAKSEPKVTKLGRGRGRKIDRQGGQRTYEFIRARGDKTTSPAMVARKFQISPEAASQRMLNLHTAGKIARVETGQYVDAAQIEKTDTK